MIVDREIFGVIQKSSRFDPAPEGQPYAGHLHAFPVRVGDVPAGTCARVSPAEFGVLIGLLPEYVDVISRTRALFLGKAIVVEPAAGLRGQVTSRRCYQFLFPLPRAFVQVYEIGYTRGPGEVAPAFRSSRDWNERFLVPGGAQLELVDLPGVERVPLKTILALEASARYTYTDDVFARGPRGGDGRLWLTDLVVEDGTHFMAVAPVRYGGHFKVRDLFFLDAGRCVQEERDEAAEVLSVDVARLPL